MYVSVCSHEYHHVLRRPYRVSLMALPFIFCVLILDARYLCICSACTIAVCVRLQIPGLLTLPFIFYVL